MKVPELPLTDTWDPVPVTIVFIFLDLDINFSIPSCVKVP